MDLMDSHAVTLVPEELVLSLAEIVETPRGLAVSPRFQGVVINVH